MSSIAAWPNSQSRRPPDRFLRAARDAPVDSRRGVLSRRPAPAAASRLGPVFRLRVLARTRRGRAGPRGQRGRRSAARPPAGQSRRRAARRARRSGTGVRSPSPQPRREPHRSHQSVSLSQDDEPRAPRAGAASRVRRHGVVESQRRNHRGYHREPRRRSERSSCNPAG
jgi:hypothetical protein